MFGGLDVMCEKCLNEIKIIRNNKNDTWQNIYASCRAIYNCSECRDKYDRELIKGLEYCFDNGLSLEKYSSDTLVAYRIILEKYIKYGNTYIKKAESILEKISNYEDIPEWYWYFKTKNSYIASKRLLTRKIKHLEEDITEYYLQEGQKPKDLCRKFSEFIDSIEKKEMETIDYIVSEDMELAKRIRDIYDEFKMTKKNNNNQIKNFEVLKIVNSNNKKVVVIGDSSVANSALTNKMKELGYKEDLVEMVINYNDIKKYDFNLLKNSSRIGVIILGPIPHQVIGINGYESIHQRMRIERGFPKLIELEKHMPISLNSFENALKEAKSYLD